MATEATRQSLDNTRQKNRIRPSTERESSTSTVSPMAWRVPAADNRPLNHVAEETTYQFCPEPVAQSPPAMTNQSTAGGPGINQTGAQPMRTYFAVPNSMIDARHPFTPQWYQQWRREVKLWVASKQVPQIPNSWQR